MRNLHPYHIIPHISPHILLDTPSPTGDTVITILGGKVVNHLDLWPHIAPDLGRAGPTVIEKNQWGRGITM